MSPTTYAIVDVIKDALTGKLSFAPKHIKEERRSICSSCEVRNVELNICTACGCQLTLKTMLTKSQCPMELW